jgi:hypothetical protein
MYYANPLGGLYPGAKNSNSVKQPEDWQLTSVLFIYLDCICPTLFLNLIEDINIIADMMIIEVSIRENIAVKV